MDAVDTNVLLYVHDYRDPAKQAIAKDLVNSLTDAVLLWQAACEYIAASRIVLGCAYRRRVSGGRGEAAVFGRLRRLSPSRGA